MTTWRWHLDSQHPYLTTTLLDQWPHGFFTRKSWPAVPEDLISRLATNAQVYRAKQVHGNRIVSAQNWAIHSPTSPLPEADAVMTCGPEQAAWVCTADCTPVLLADVDTGQVAAVHAGWRGSALRIVPKTIAKMQAQGSELSHLRIALGPAVAGEVYQVSTHVAAEVGRSLVNTISDLAKKTDDELVTELQAFECPPVLPDVTPGRVRLDVRRVNVLQVQALGIQAEQIAIAPHCTYQEPETFFSYRRTHEKKVQWSGIVNC